MFYVAIRTKALMRVNTGTPGRNLLHIFDDYEEGKAFVQKAEENPTYVETVGYWDTTYNDVVTHQTK